MHGNKGNLFDSEKYINSLREDIVIPLQSLRSFLKNQQEKLQANQKELQKVRVRVGPQDPGKIQDGQLLLASKRSESILTELTENIAELDVMIEKMG